MSWFFKRIFSRRGPPGVQILIFDFDGTIADTKELLFRIVSHHLAKFNISLTKHLVSSFGNAPLRDYLSIAGVKKELVESVVSSINDSFIEEYQKIKSCKGLHGIANIKVPKIIVSNNDTQFIKKSLGYLNAEFFDEVYGCDRFGSKVDAIRRILKKYKAVPSETAYVADKYIDVQIARTVGCYSIIVSNKSSWSTRKEISKEQPDFIINSLGNLPQILDGIDVEQLPAV